MSLYQDKWTRWHNAAATPSKEYPSNNGWIYTAYSKYLAPETTSFEKLTECFDRCCVSSNRFNRSPGQMHPPLSKDELIGMVSCGVYNANDVWWLAKENWNFCNLLWEKVPMSLGVFFKALKALWKIRKEHRNHVWQNHVYDAFPLAFQLSLPHRYYVKKVRSYETTIWEWLAFNINYHIVKWRGAKYSRMILWLELKDMNDKRADKLPWKNWVRDYFKESHPFVKRLNDE